MARRAAHVYHKRPDHASRKSGGRTGFRNNRGDRGMMVRIRLYRSDGAPIGEIQSPAEVVQRWLAGLHDAETAELCDVRDLMDPDHENPNTELGRSREAGRGSTGFRGDGGVMPVPVSPNGHRSTPKQWPAAEQTRILGLVRGKTDHEARRTRRESEQPSLRAGS